MGIVALININNDVINSIYSIAYLLNIKHIQNKLRKFATLDYPYNYQLAKKTNIDYYTTHFKPVIDFQGEGRVYDILFLEEDLEKIYKGYYSMHLLPNSTSIAFSVFEILSGERHE